MVGPNLSPAAAFAILGVLAILPVADAFVPSLPSSSRFTTCSASCSVQAGVPHQRMMVSNKNNNHDAGDTSKNEHTANTSNDVGILGALGLAAAVLASGGVPAMAATTTATITNVQASSTIHLSETIKTMEFSLPSSYDSIADAKSAATDELTVTVNPTTGATRAPRAKSSGGGGGGSKQPAMTSEERAALKAARDAQKAAEQAAREAAAAADKDAAAAAAEAKRTAAAAVRELEKEQKAAEAKLKKEAAAEKQESKKAAAISSNVDVVDMGLPSYSESAKTEGKKSAFSL